jgi:hypothetical protein
LGSNGSISLITGRGKEDAGSYDACVDILLSQIALSLIFYDIIIPNCSVDDDRRPSTHGAHLVKRRIYL